MKADPTFLYTNTTWKTQRHPSFFFVLQSAKIVPIFFLYYCSTPHNGYFSRRKRRKTKEEKRGAISLLGLLAGSVLESWVLVLASAGWLTDWMAEDDVEESWVLVISVEGLDSLPVWEELDLLPALASSFPPSLPPHTGKEFYFLFRFGSVFKRKSRTSAHFVCACVCFILY